MITYTSKEAGRLINFNRAKADCPALMSYESDSGTEEIRLHIDEVFDFEEVSGEELLGDVLPDNLFADLLAWAESEEIMEHQKATGGTNA
jgi:hypothetical protein